jgi:hypothetical protein
MTLAVLVAIAIVAAPVVLLISTAGCATIAGIELPPIRHADYGKYGDDVLSTPGLEGYWRLGEKNSVLTAPTPPEPTAVNTLQPVHDGTYKNTGPTALKDSIQLEQKGPLYYDTDTAAFFVGDGGYVEVPSLGTFIEIAIEVWAKLADAQPNWRVVVGCYEPKNATDTIQTGYRIRIRTDPSDSEIVQVEGAVGGLNIPLPIQSLRGKTIWHHIVLSANGQHAELYLDENPAKPADGQFELTPTLTATPLRIGADQTDPPTTYRGYLDEVALYGQFIDGKVVERHREATVQVLHNVSP